MDSKTCDEIIRNEDLASKLATYNQWVFELRKDLNAKFDPKLLIVLQTVQGLFEQLGFPEKVLLEDRHKLDGLLVRPGKDLLADAGSQGNRRQSIKIV